MGAGPINRALLTSFYQNAGDTYDDNKTEGAFGVLADQADANYAYLALLVANGTLSPYPAFLFRQAVINGGFDVPTRGTSFANPAANTYTLDRWSVSYDGTIGTFTVSQQSFAVGQTSVPNNPKYFLRWNQTVAGSASNFRLVSTTIEGVRLFAGQKCTLSFWAKADAARTIPQISFRQSFGSGGAPSALLDANSGAINLTTSWQLFTITVTMPSISGRTLGTNNDDYLGLLFYLPVNTVMTIDIAQVQFNVGDIALPFQPKSYQEEEALSQRYNQRLGGSPYTVFGVGESVSTTRAYVFVPLLKKMRILPTLTSSVPGAFRLLVNNTSISATGLGTDAAQSTSDRICLVVDVAGGLTVGQLVIFTASNDSTAFINFEAEL